jgi:hypothetical protein
MDSFLPRALSLLTLLLVALPLAAQHPAVEGGDWDTTFSLAGPDGPVNAMAIVGDDIYVGEEFERAGGDVEIFGVARWDIAARRWDSLGAGIGSDTRCGTVRALAADARYLYAEGDFTTLRGRLVGSVVRYSFADRRWSGLGAGIGIYSDRVYAIASEGGSIWVGGSLHYMDGSYYWKGNRPTNGLARWRPWLAPPVSAVANVVAGIAGATALPNPTRGDVTITAPGDIQGNADLFIFDIGGDVVAHIERTITGSDGGTIVWHTEGVASGIYFYHF